MSIRMSMSSNTISLFISKFLINCICIECEFYGNLLVMCVRQRENQLNWIVKCILICINNLYEFSYTLRGPPGTLQTWETVVLQCVYKPVMDGLWDNGPLVMTWKAPKPFSKGARAACISFWSFDYLFNRNHHQTVISDRGSGSGATFWATWLHSPR